MRAVFLWDRAFARRFLMVALPIVIQDLVASSLHIIDGVMIGQLGDAPYAAVTQANRFTFVFQLFLFGAASGCGIFFSQFWGNRDLARMRSVMGLALRVAGVLTLLFAGSAIFFTEQVVALFLPRGESFDWAVEYLSVVAPGYFITAVDTVYASCMKSAEQTRIPMLAGIASILLNTFLNWALIYGHLGFPAMGVRGAAIATVISAGLSLVINVGASYALKLPSAVRLRELRLPDRAFCGRFFRLVLPVVFNEGLWSTGITMYSVFYGRLGDAAVAAMGIFNTVDQLINVLVYGIMNASAILVGGYLGAGERDGAWLTAKRMLTACVAAGATVGALLALSRGALVGMFKVSPEARGIALIILLEASLFYWLRAINSINVVGVLRSGGDTLYSMLLDTSALWLIGVPLVGMAALWWRLPIQQVYLFTIVEEVIKAVIGLRRFRSKKWMHVLTERETA